jgi:hypothetical protein
VRRKPFLKITGINAVFVSVVLSSQCRSPKQSSVVIRLYCSAVFSELLRYPRSINQLFKDLLPQHQFSMSCSYFASSSLPCLHSLTIYPSASPQCSICVFRMLPLSTVLRRYFLARGGAPSTIKGSSVGKVCDLHLCFFGGTGFSCLDTWLRCPNIPSWLPCSRGIPALWAFSNPRPRAPLCGHQKGSAAADAARRLQG